MGDKMSNRSGQFQMTLSGYNAFIPSSLPPMPPLLLDYKMQNLLERANIALGGLKNIEGLLPNPELLIRRYATKEALLSSQIEGTQSSLIEIMEEQNNLIPNQKVDVIEVLNYIKAISFGIKKLKDDDFPMSLRLLKEMHAILMDKVRGGENNKTPGEFRTSQNWIGGTSPKNAFFVPPTPQEIMLHLGEMEKYFYENDYPNLIKVALLHYQFETIHPFCDGNGRIGRLIITLYLIWKDILNSPTLYLSLFFKKHKTKYYELLTAVREKGEYENWVMFFLEGVEEVSNQVIATTKKILDLQKQDNLKIQSLGGNAFKLLNLLSEVPVITVKDAENKLNLSYATINNLVGTFEKLEILKQITGGKRNRKYVYKDYVEILNEGI